MFKLFIKKNQLEVVETGDGEFKSYNLKITHKNYPIISVSISILITQ